MAEAQEPKPKKDEQKSKANHAYQSDESCIAKVTYQVHLRGLSRDLRAKISFSFSRLRRLSTRQTQSQSPNYTWSIAITEEFKLVIYRRKPERKTAKALHTIDLADFHSINIKRDDENSKKYESIQLFFNSGLSVKIDFSTESQNSRKAREAFEKIRDAVVKANTTLEKLTPKVTNSTLPVRIELDAGSPDLAKGAEFLNTENYIFQWEATEGVPTSNGLHKRLSKMTFLNEHRSFELSRNDFRKWYFEPINIDDMTVKGRLHTKKESPLGHVILTLIFVDPYRLFHTIYKPLLEFKYYENKESDRKSVSSDPSSRNIRADWAERRQWNKMRGLEQRGKNSFDFPLAGKSPSGYSPRDKWGKRQSGSYKSVERKSSSATPDKLDQVKNPEKVSTQQLNSIGELSGFSP